MGGLTVRQLRAFLKRLKPLAPDTTAQERSTSSGITPELQLSIWKELSGKWKERGSKEEQIAEIYRDRTVGRDFSL